MNLQSSSSPIDPPLKRKRGRPRKDENQVQGDNLLAATPGSDSVRKNKPIGGTTGADSDEMLGQMVSGVIEGSFDAGYLVNVKVGDTDTQLRGLVFLPGRFTPITAANDVAPQAKMYKRTEMPIPVLTPSVQPPSSVLSSEQDKKQSSSIIQSVTDSVKNRSAAVMVQNQQPAPSADGSPGTETVNLELEMQPQAMSNDVKSNQLLDDEEKDPNQTPVIAEPEMISSKPIGIDVWMEKQASPNKLTSPLELNLKITSANDTSPLNGKPSGLSSLTEAANTPSAPMTNHLLTHFEREAIPSATKLAVDSSTLQSLIEPQLFNSSTTANITKAASGSESMTNLSVTLFEKEAIPSEPKLTINGPVLSTLPEPQFCTPPVPVRNVDCNIKDVGVAPAES